MSDIGKGDYVEFYQTWRGRPIPPGCNIELGRIYRVEGVQDTNADPGEGSVPGAQLEGISWRGKPAAVPLECLRHVYRPKSSLIQKLKKRSKARA